MDEKEIERLRLVYNKKNPKNTIAENADINKVWETLKKRFKNECDGESGTCVLSGLLSASHNPLWQTDPEHWMTSDDIENVEKEYGKIFANYYFVGTFPIDFDKTDGRVKKMRKCLISSLCSLRLSELAQQGKTQIGIVFNTDVDSGPGKHWIALFCDISPELEHPRITYFDSYAERPEKEIQVLMRRWKKEWDSGAHAKAKMQMTYNNTRHQYKDSECGMYCLYFHWACLNELPMDERIPDDVVYGFRGVLFDVED
jgi:hypothetical protein